MQGRGGVNPSPGTGEIGVWRFILYPPASTRPEAKASADYQLFRPAQTLGADPFDRDPCGQ